tara:strand:- start:824 stop:1012 length:189 start_codon:yes stop_codon:yes gene_type:complete
LRVDAFSFGTYLNRRGTDINKIKEAMRHKVIATTQRYLHVGVEDVREDLNKNFQFNLSAPRE